MRAWIEKTDRVAVAITLLSTIVFAHISKAQDIFSTPVPPPRIDTQSTPYTTSAAFFADTKNGTIADQLTDRDHMYDNDMLESFGRSIRAILQNEYSVRITGHNNDNSGCCGYMLKDITNYEMTNHNDPEAVRQFQQYRQTLALEAPPEFMLAFDGFLKKYSSAIRDDLDAKQRAETLQQAAIALQQATEVGLMLRSKHERKPLMRK